MQNINGFIVLGNYWINDKNVYKCITRCRICNKEFETNYHALHRMKSCGCARPSPMKPVPNIINGVKVVKDLGFVDLGHRKERRIIAECLICYDYFETCPRYLKKQVHCGCMKNGVIKCKYVRSHPQLVQALKHMKARCYNEKNQDYYNYGARDITVCDEWLANSNVFCEWAIVNGFENNKNLSIDRIDNNKGYCPENCRWSDPTAQSRNTRRTKLTIELARKIREEYKIMSQQKIADKYKVSQGTIGLVVRNVIWKEI
jgi:hypothetical protein